MARPTGWDILGLDADPTPGVLETVQDLAKQFGDFAHDVQAAYGALNSFGADATALDWVGQTAEAFKGQFGPLPGRLQKLYVSYSEASDALSAYAPALQSAQSKADSALRQAQDAHVDLQRAQTSAASAADDLKTAQQNHAANPDPRAVADAQSAHDSAQTSLKNAQGRMDALKAQANQASDDLDRAAGQCAKALGHAQSDGIHNKHWWEHVGAFLSEWGGKIAEIANDLAPFLDVLALATSWIPGVDVITAGLAEADNLVALAGTALKITGDAMQGHWGDALMGAGMLGLTFLGGKALGSLGGKVMGKLGREAEEGAEGAVGAEARTAEGGAPAITKDDPVDVVSGWMLTDATDVELPGVLPLILRRAYASGYTTGHLFGPGWSSTLDQRLSVNEAGIHFAGDDSERLDYPLPADGAEVLPERGARWPLTWDRDADEIRVTDPWSGRTLHFPTVHHGNEVGQIRDLTAISDRNGNQIRILRAEDGTPTLVEHAAYAVAVDTIASATGPRISALRLVDGVAPGADLVLKRYSYDERGRLTGVVNSSDLPFGYEWDDADRITAWRDRSGYRYGYVYDEFGRVVGGQGRFLAGSFAYDAANRTTVHTDSLGHVTTYVYDENGHVCLETDPLGHTTRTETDRHGRVLSRTDALGAVTTLARDAAGDVRRVTAPDGAVSEAEYNELHQIVRATRPDGATWLRGYDERGNLLSVTDPEGALTRFEYHPGGAPAATTGPLDSVTRFQTDAAGLPTAVTDPAGGTTRAVRDPAGRIVRTVNPLGSTVAFEWNAEGLLLSRTEADGTITRWEHDPSGVLVRVTDPAGGTTVYEPGPMGTLIARTGPDGVRHTFGYDSELNLLSVTNPAGASWQYSYDAVGQLIGETDFVGRSLGYEYDAAGKLTARVTGTGQRITLDRDAAGRVVARQTPEGGYRYSYDAAGRITSAAGPGSTLAYEYDRVGRLLAETVDGRVMRHSYDAAGRAISRVTASGAESVWAYDAAGRPVSLDAGSGRLEFAFDAAGQEIRRLFGAGAWLDSRYDEVGRPLAQDLVAGERPADQDAAPVAGGVRPASNTTVALSRSWVWRADGVPEEIRDSTRGTRRIVSDAAGRITAVSARGWSESYAYDAFGNVSGGIDGGADGGLDGGAGAEGSDRPVSLAHRTQVQKAGRTRHQYDEAGRLVRTTRRTLDGRQKTWTYRWDSQDRLVQAVTPDRGTWQYSYDPVGRRTGKFLVGADGGLDRRALFIWDGPRLAEEQIPGADGVISTTTWDYDPGTFRPAAQRRRSRVAEAEQSVIDEAFHAIVTDLVGTPTELVTADGRVVWHSTTTVWGGSVGVAAEAGSGVDCPLRFPGQYHDGETGLHYNLNRYYDPETAAYLTPDPLGLVPAPNDRAYVPNPLTVTDPLGLSYEENTGGADAPGTGEDTPVDGPSSKYEDVTGKGARMKNVSTDVGPTEFGGNLEANGWARSDKGPNIMYEKDGARYFLRPKASSHDGWTADFYNPGSKKADIKFRLGDD